MQIKLLGTVLMLLTLLACKKKEEKLRLEPLLVGTTWEIAPFEGEQNVVLSNRFKKSWSSLDTRTESISLVYATLQNNPAGLITKQLTFEEPNKKVDDQGNAHDIYYIQDKCIEKIKSPEECKPAVYAMKNWFLASEDYDIIEKIKKDYASSNICRTRYYTKQNHFSISENSLYFNGITYKDETIYTEDLTKRNLGKETLERLSIGTWNIAYSKK
jgi:hypothetical protein